MESPARRGRTRGWKKMQVMSQSHGRRKREEESEQSAVG